MIFESKERRRNLFTHLDRERHLEAKTNPESMKLLSDEALLYLWEYVLHKDPEVKAQIEAIGETRGQPK